LKWRKKIQKFFDLKLYEKEIKNDRVGMNWRKRKKRKKDRERERMG